MQSTCTPIASLTRSASGILEASEAQTCPEANGSSRAVFPARIFPSLVKALGWRVSDPASGTSTPELLASYDPDSQSWKTSELSLFGDSIPYSGALPKSGMMRSGRIYAPPMSERPTEGNGSGLWRTPTLGMLNADRAKDPEYGSRKQAKGQTITLADQVRGMWPTPRANDAEKRGNFDATNPRNGLPAAVKLWPTPVATMYKGSSPAALTRKSGKDRSKDRLDHAMQAQEGSGQLNPTWVEWLMGYPLGWTDSSASGIALSLKSPC